MNKCPLCEKEFKDILKHISLFHNVRNMENLNNIVEKDKKSKRKIIKFGHFVKELNEKLKKGEIKGKDFREAVQRWERENG